MTASVTCEVVIVA